MIAFLEHTYFGNTLIRYLVFIIIIIIAAVVGKIVFYISRNVLQKKAARTKNRIDDLLVQTLEKPLVFLIFIIGLSIALKTLTFSSSADTFFGNVVEIILTIDIFWFVIVFIDALIVNYVAPLTAKTKSDLDDVLLPVVRKIVKVTITCLAIIIIFDNFGYDVTSLIAGLGIGGLAFALAAKDMLANLFGGVTIMTDKPFKLGDRIKIESYDGIVEDIGLRSTRLKTLDGFQLVVPNATIANSILENVTKEKSRKVKMNIGVEYSTSMQKMKEAKKIIEEIVIKNEDTDDKSIVSFNMFGESALNFLIIYWIKNLDNILNAQHNINMEIKRRFEKAKINIAFPSTTVYLKK
ncbi:mechanosensitive ion channel family protein [archaeon]|nr:mechanosensitive ion channel family protein [archaeon]MBL7057263.1 mechanosensitive ion channel family protein [Candidatus Woesearchaeota archaeon]